MCRLCKSRWAQHIARSKMTSDIQQVYPSNYTNQSRIGTTWSTSTQDIIRLGKNTSNAWRECWGRHLVKLAYIPTEGDPSPRLDNNQPVSIHEKACAFMITQVLALPHAHHVNLCAIKSPHANPMQYGMWLTWLNNPTPAHPPQQVRHIICNERIQLALKHMEAKKVGYLWKGREKERKVGISDSLSCWEPQKLKRRQQGKDTAIVGRNQERKQSMKGKKQRGSGR